MGTGSLRAMLQCVRTCGQASRGLFLDRLERTHYPVLCQMEICMVNVSGRLSSDGSRLVSALLKREGHVVHLVFMSRTEPLLYQQEELERLRPLLDRSEIVMISVYSSYAVRAVQISDFVHEKFPGKKVFWGGPHCISVPELGLRHADGVCYSEGDVAVTDLVRRISRGEEWSETANFAFRRNGENVRNAVLPPFRELDGLPYYDFDLQDQYLLDHSLTQLTVEKLKERLAAYPYRIPTFYFMTSRGCPHNCAYCNNCRYTALWGTTPVRLHGVERVIQELEHHIANMPFIEFIGFGDDDFFMRPPRELQEFAAKYRARIGLPFGIAVSARTWKLEKAEMLLDSGLAMIQMGVQSGSQRVLDSVYNRYLDLSRVDAAVREISGLAARGRRLNLHLDFIIDNPYETRDDIAKTFHYLLSTPWQARPNIFFLAYFPGTPLYERALADGYIRAYSQQAFRPYTRSRLRYQKNWETFLVLLLRSLRLARKHEGRALRVFLRILGSRTVRTIMSCLPRAFFSGLARLLQSFQAAMAARKAGLFR